MKDRCCHVGQATCAARVGLIFKTNAGYSKYNAGSDVTLSIFMLWQTWRKEKKYSKCSWIHGLLCILMDHLRGNSSSSVVLRDLETAGLESDVFL